MMILLPSRQGESLYCIWCGNPMSKVKATTLLLTQSLQTFVTKLPRAHQQDVEYRIVHVLNVALNLQNWLKKTFSLRRQTERQTEKKKKGGGGIFSSRNNVIVSKPLLSFSWQQSAYEMALYTTSDIKRYGFRRTEEKNHNRLRYSCTKTSVFIFQFPSRYFHKLKKLP